MEDGKNSTIEKEENFKNTTDLASLRLMLDYVGFKGVDPSLQLENFLSKEENPLIGAYVVGSVGGDSVRRFLLITECDKVHARGFRVSIGWDNRQGAYIFNSTKSPVKFDDEDISIKSGNRVFYEKSECKRISLQDFSRIYTASKVLMEMGTQLSFE